MARLIKMIQGLTSSMCSLQKQHERAMSQADERHQKLTTENAELRQRVSDLSQQASSDHWRQLNKPHGTVLIGSSIIRYISDDKLVATRCICRRGGVIKDLQEALDNLPTDKPLSRIILIDSESDDLDVTGITAQYRDLVECAKSRATKVTICSVCPRIKSITVSQRIESLNAGLKGIAGDLGVDYLDNDPIFHLQDGTLNDGYLLADGVHLTRPATNRLVAHMQLPLRQGENSAYSDHRRRASKQDPPGPTSDGDTDDGFSHPFWRKAHQKDKSQHQSTPRPHTARHATESPLIGDTNARASQWSHKRNAFTNAGPYIHPPRRHFEQLRPQARRQMAMPGPGGRQTPLSRTPPPPRLMDIATHPPISSHTREPVQTRTYRDTPMSPSSIQWNPPIHPRIPRALNVSYALVMVIRLSLVRAVIRSVMHARTMAILPVYVHWHPNRNRGRV